MTTSDRRSWVNGKHDGHAFLIQLDDNKQIELWGNSYSNRSFNQSFDDVIETPIIDTKNKYIIAPFRNKNTLEIWNFNGELINTTKLNFSPDKIVMTPDAKILIRDELNYKFDKKVNISAYNINLEPLNIEFLENEFGEIGFTNDGKYIILYSTNETKIFDYHGNIAYKFDFKSYFYGDRIYINEDFINLYDRWATIYPLSNIYNNLIKLIEVDKIFGEMPELSEEIQLKFNQVTNSK